MYQPSIAIGLAITGLLLLSFAAVCSDRFWRGLAHILLLMVITAFILLVVAGSETLSRLCY
jgi:hypothetical protein